MFFVYKLQKIIENYRKTIIAKTGYVTTQKSKKEQNYRIIENKILINITGYSGA